MRHRGREFTRLFMSDQSEQKTSSLDEATLKALEAAEAGLPSALLDDGFLADTDFLDDNTPLVLRNEEEHIAARAARDAAYIPPARRPRQAAARKRASTQAQPAPTGDEATALIASAQANTTDAAIAQSLPDDDLIGTSDEGVQPVLAEASAPKEAPIPIEDMDAWLEEEPPLDQSLLDALVVRETHRREALEGAATAAPVSSSETSPTAKPEKDISEPVDSAPTPVLDDNNDDTLSQEELNALIAGKSDTPTTPEPAPEDDSSMSQADLDALIAGQSDTPTTPEPAVEDGSPMSQADLDALIAGQSETPSTPEPAVEDDSPMSQADLDALIAGQSDTPTTPEPAVEDDSPMSQADLDALIAGQSETPSTPEPAVEDDSPMSQEDLDALIAGQSDTPTTPEPADEDDGPMSQEDLDALIAGQSDTPTTPEPDVEDDSPMSQADLDAMISGEIETPEPAVEDDSPMSQDDLDALIAGQDEAPTQPEANDDAPLSQDDLDALLGGQDEASAEPQAEGGGLLSQADLDALLSGGDSADSSSATALDDDELSELFDAQTGAPKDPAQDGTFDQSDIDALIVDSGDESPLNNDQLDAPILPDEIDGDDISLSKSSIDSLMADLDNSGVLDGLATDAGSPEEEEEEEDDGEIGDISQDMIDSLIASAQQEASDERSAASQSEIGSENLAAAATASDSGPDLLSQSDLDKLIEASKEQDKERSKAKQNALESAIDAAQASARGEGPPTEKVQELSPSKAPKKRFRKQSPLAVFVKENALRLVACFLVGSVFATGTGLFMTINREVRPHTNTARDEAALDIALERSRDMLANGNYLGVVDELDRPIERAYPGELRNDALYVRLEAQYRGFHGEWGSPAFDEMTGRIDEVLKAAPAHPRAPEALYWKAQLFSKDQPLAALEIYKNIFEQYEDAPNRDRMLLDAAQLALRENDPLTTAIYAQNLLSQYPASVWAGEARLAYADAQQRAGNSSDARTIYIRMAQEAPDSTLGAKALVRLGRLAYESGEYENAKRYLTNHLETTTTLDGNDEVYLLLAQTYRAADELENARDTLTDLLAFFEDSPLRPDAFIEQSQVYEALGEREHAVKTAQRAALEFPHNPRVLRNDGELQGLDGNPLAAALAFVAADDAGAADPNLLLNAARYYRAALMPGDAIHTYERLKNHYGGSPEALNGGIEVAQLRHEQGKTERALEDLKALKAATQGTSHYLPTLEAMQTIYKDLGLDRHVNSTAKEIISEAAEPETFAQAAVDLIDTGDLESAQSAIEKFDLARLRPRTAFNLLMKEGEALLSIAPQRGLEKMEQAYFNYPESRTQDSDQALLRTYLNTGRAAAARRMVMDLKAHVDDAPIDTPYLVDAAIAWGDYLYEKEDYRTATFAFSIAEEASESASIPVTGLRSDPDWARYQRANALLQLADYTGCLTLYEQIAASDSPWAQEAGVKANIARLEQRQRGMPMAQAPQAG